MKDITFIATNDLVLETELGTVEYKKGSTVFIESDDNDDVYISYHEADDKGIHSYELDISDFKIFENILDNVLVKEEELNEEVSFKNMSLDQLVVEEEMTVPQVTCYMTEVSYKKKSVVRAGKKTIISVPIRTRKKILSPKQRAAMKINARKMARNPMAKRNRIKSMKVRSRMGMNDSYFVDFNYMLNESKKFVCAETVKVLKRALKDRAKIMTTKESDISVRLLQADKKEVLEAIKLAGVNYFVEELESTMTIKLIKPAADSVVKSYYSEKKEQDGEDETCDCGEPDCEICNGDSEDDMDMEEKSKKKEGCKKGKKKEGDSEEDPEDKEGDGMDTDGDSKDGEDDLDEKKKKGSKK